RRTDADRARCGGADRRRIVTRGARKAPILKQRDLGILFHVLNRPFGATGPGRRERLVVYTDEEPHGGLPATRGSIAANRSNAGRTASTNRRRGIFRSRPSSSVLTR